MFSVIAAVDNANGIGKDGKIPWDFPADLKHFKQVTSGNIVIMGRKTYESIGKPLPDRTTCVISRTMQADDRKAGDNLHVFNDPWDCVRWCQNNRIQTVTIDGTTKRFKRHAFVCGGAEIYDWFYANHLITYEIITRIYDDYKCDTKINRPDAERNCCLIRSLPLSIEDSNKLSLQKFRIVNQEERSMLSLIGDVMRNGYKKDDRTGTGTVSLFGKHLEFDLTDNKFPLMTTRPMFFHGIFEELMLYLRGQTDSKILEAKNVKVWAPNTSREFLDKNNLGHYRVGDMGHTYGFSMRHFGAEYKGCDADYTGQGYDQLMNLIEGIKTNPNGRRHLISLWEPNKIEQAALPPCLYEYQFYVHDGMLSCQMGQRSSDIVTAGGWNVATGALMTILIAHACGLKPEKLIWNIGDVHIYNNIIDAARQQVCRFPNAYPKLFLRGMPDDITKTEFNNLELIGYEPLPMGDIKIIMNV